MPAAVGAEVEEADAAVVVARVAVEEAGVSLVHPVAEAAGDIHVHPVVVEASHAHLAAEEGTLVRREAEASHGHPAAEGEETSLVRQAAIFLDHRAEPHGHHNCHPVEEADCHLRARRVAIVHPSAAALHNCHRAIARKWAVEIVPRNCQRHVRAARIVPVA